MGLVGLDGTKMSKSLGNLVFVEDLVARAESAARSTLAARPALPQSTGSGAKNFSRARSRDSQPGVRRSRPVVRVR